MKRTFVSENEMRHRWFPLWLLVGLGLAVLLLVNSIANYLLFSRRILVDHTRQGIAAQRATFDHLIQRAEFGNSGQLDTLLEQIRQQSKVTILWLQLRDGNGATIAHAGPGRTPEFSSDFVRSRFRNREAVYRTVASNAGQAVVEAFPVRLPAAVSPAALQPVAYQHQTDRARRMGVIEIAALIQAGSETFWPLRRNLLINCSAAFVLLLAVTMMGLHFPSYVEGRQMERQLEIARRVQAQLLPPAKQRISAGFDVAADCESATHVGGDFYDVFSTAGGGSAFLLGDVCGKGIPAALLMGVLHGAARASSWSGSSSHHEAATGDINRLLYERASRERYATMFWSYIDPGTRRLHYINAGHCPPLLFRANQGEIVRLTDGGPVLGLLPGAAYQQKSVAWEPGDILVAYSDGIVEATGSSGEEFGEERLMKIIECARDRSAEEIRDRILSSLRAFTEGAGLDDDRTLLVIRNTFCQTVIRVPSRRVNVYPSKSSP